MRKLGEKNYALISQGLNITGSYDPNETMFIFEEQLYTSEASEVREFMHWCHDNNKSFGSGNYEERFSEFLKSKGIVFKKLYLKKLKVHEDMSEETTCFSADLYEGGKLMAHVENTGKGGCTNFRPARDLKYNDISHLENSDVECEIDEIIHDMDVAKRYQSKALVLKKGEVYSKIGFKVSIAQMKKNPAQYLQLQGIIKKEKAKGFEVLNTNL